jgi:hypothetical protein
MNPYGGVVNFTPGPRYPRYQLDRRLGGPPQQVWATWRRENSWPYRDSNYYPLGLQPVASRYMGWKCFAGPEKKHEPNILRTSFDKLNRVVCMIDATHHVSTTEGGPCSCWYDV